MGPTSRQRRLAEADMSRRQFLKLTGQAAAAAANPQAALKGLAGLAPAASTPIMIAVRPMKEYSANITVGMANIQKAFNAAKNIGNGKVGGAAAGCGEAFEVLTFGNLEDIKQLVKSGKLKPVASKTGATFENFGAPITPEETAAVTKETTANAIKSWHQWHTGILRDNPHDEKKLKDYVNSQVSWYLKQKVADRSELRFKDAAGNNYWITADNDAMQDKTGWFKDVINSQVSMKESPLGDWFEMYYGMGNLEDIEFTKQSLEFIKQHGLHRRVDDPFGMRRLVDEFNKHGVELPADLPKVLEKFGGRPNIDVGGSSWHTKYSDIKPGENFISYQDRKRQEREEATKQTEAEKQKQRQEFDAAPPPSDEPDAWRTQSVEFEERLRRLVR